ncbi:MAG: hybrid sensor histidine kinase/response regulator [Snowella sp.]|nr:hybrid sensor histidine kinase/response regulator [Snowella sp.]
MIEDQELREIYQVSGAEHVQNLETGLLTLEKDPTNIELLQTLLREAHSLKGDSRVIGVKSVEALSHRLEEILGRIKNSQMVWSQALGQRMYQTVGALGKLVHEAVTDEPSNVDPNQLLNLLSEFLPALDTQAPASVPAPKEHQTVGNGHGNGQHKPNGHGRSLWIEDADLRDIYKISSEEHLNKLQSGLIVLDENPDDQASLEELLSESQSFELDSRIVGQESLEALIHKVEVIFESLKAAQISFSQVSQPLHHAVDAIGDLVKEALTGETAQVNFQEIVQELDGVIQTDQIAQVVQEPSQPTAKGNGATSSQASLDMARLDTIRVPMRYLDALMTHTGELTVTKTRLAHTSDRLRDLIHLWDAWKTRKKSNKGSEKATEEKLDNIIRYLYGSVAENNTRLDAISRELDEKIRTLRLLPLSTIFLLFPRLVRELAQDEAKDINFVMEGGNITVDKQILEEMKDPLLHLLRNAVDHAIETPQERQRLGKAPQGKVWLKASRSASNIVIEVGDDGRGLDLEKIKQTAIKRKLYRAEELAAMGPNQLRSLIFLPGFSTRSFITEISGRGVGLDIVRTNVERLKGNIQIESNANQGTIFRIQLRSTVATLNVMLVEIRGLIHALPIEAIEKTLLIRPQEVYSLEGQPTISVDGKPIPLVKMADILELPAVTTGAGQKQRQRQVENNLLSAVLLNVEGQTLAFEVDKLQEVLDVVIKPQTKLLKRVRNILGATILGTGEVCMILNPQDLVRSVRKQHQSTTMLDSDDLDAAPVMTQKPVILLVEDSIAVRTQEKRILEKAGYEVVIAVDGLDGYNKLRSGQAFDGIISDVEMPNMNGLAFTAKVREHPEYRELPLILVTSLASEEDKRRGAQAGANAYIVKDQFNQELLIETLERLV